MEVDSLRHDAAAIAFDAADELLGDLSGDEDQEWVDVWLEVHVDGRANLYNQLTDCPGRAAAVLARARPVVELRGSRTIRASFYTNLANQRHAKPGFVLTMKPSPAPARQCTSPPGASVTTERTVSATSVSTCSGVATSTRRRKTCTRLSPSPNGHMTKRARRGAWEPLLVGARRHDVEAVRCFSHQASEAAWDPGNPFTVAATVAARAWLPLKDGRVEKTSSAMPMRPWHGGPKCVWLSITTRAFAFGR